MEETLRFPCIAKRCGQAWAIADRAIHSGDLRLNVCGPHSLRFIKNTAHISVATSFSGML